MKRIAKVGLFLGSYSPLFILLCLLEWNNSLLGSLTIRQITIFWLPLLFALLAVLGIIITLTLLSVAKTIAPIFIKPTVTDKRGEETLAYLITYLIPFIGFRFDSLPSATANVVLFVMIGFLYVQSNMIYLNPLLSIMGYKIYKIKINGKIKLMLAKNEVQDENRTKVIPLSEGIYIESK